MDRNTRKDSKTLVPIKGLTPSVIRFRPTNRTPKPMAISAMGLEDLVLMNISSTMPMTKAIGARVSVSKSHSRKLPSDSTLPRRISWAVTVVPMFAPITMDTACFRFSTPAPISATVSTMVAVELWITAVTRVPVRTPMTTLPVTFSRTRFKAAPELFFRPSPMSSIP